MLTFSHKRVHIGEELTMGAISPIQTNSDFAIQDYYDCKVLYVGNNSRNLAIVREALRALGLVIIDTGNKRNVLGIVRTESPDLILMEEKTSAVKDLDLCETLRSNPNIPPIPVVFLLASLSTKDQIAALKSGADGLLADPPNSELLLAMVRNLLSRHKAEVKNFRLLRILEKYISSRAREKVGQTGTEKINATILFSDMRGFTEVTMRKRVEDVFQSISALHARQVEIIHHFGGYIDKFTGDGLLAAFDEGTTHITDACRAALAIIRSLPNCKEIQAWNPPPIGIGIHSGEVVRGNIGGPEHMDFSVIGNTVNIAARLCGQAKPLEIIISEVVARNVRSHFSLDEGRIIRLKGVGDSRIHQLISEHPRG